MIPVITASQLYDDLLPYPLLVKSLRKAFHDAAITNPERQHYEIPQDGDDAQTLLVMPAWQAGVANGVKIVSVIPGNANRYLPTVQGTYILFDGKTGISQAIIDGPALTAIRTAAASALAASYLARADSKTMLMVGAGALSLPLMMAHGALIPLQHIMIWGRNQKKAKEKAQEARKTGLPVEAVHDLEDAVRKADLISCATLANQPLIKGAWLRPGCHLDLVGGFTPKMREADDDAIRKATLFVDTRKGAMKEAGDIIDPMQRGLINASSVKADLFDLAQGKHEGRTANDEITLFKSVGTAIEDLVAAQLAYARFMGQKDVDGQG